MEEVAGEGLYFFLYFLLTYWRDVERERDLADEEDDDDSNQHDADLQLLALGGRRHGGHVVLKITCRATHLSHQAHVQHQNHRQLHLSTFDSHLKTYTSSRFPTVIVRVRASF